MEYEYNCSYFQHNNVTPPNIVQQLQGNTRVERCIQLITSRWTIRLLISNLLTFSVFKSIGQVRLGRGNRRYNHYDTFDHFIYRQRFYEYQKESGTKEKAALLDHFHAHGGLDIIAHHISRSQGR